MKTKVRVGIDEVGRGPIAGPVAVCVCILEERQYQRMQWKGLTDSKKMTPKARQAWYSEAQRLQTRGILRYYVAFCSNQTIDRKGISFAINQCIEKSLQKLSLNPNTTTVLLDGGLRAPEEYRHQKTIIRGDIKQKIISLASVIAKVTRDTYMLRMHKKYPNYHFDTNKGYGTREHYRALKQYGMTPLHRKTFLQQE